MATSPPVLPTSFTQCLNYATTSLSLSTFAVISTLIAPILLVWIEQGREVLDMVSDEQILDAWRHWTTLLQYLLFLLALHAWGFANWYGSRVLLQFNFHNPLPEDTLGGRFILRWNEWQPRVLGILGMALIALYILFVRRQWVAGGIAAASVGVFAWYVAVGRRRRFKLPSVKDSTRDHLRKGDRLAVWLSTAASLALFIALTTVNYSFARMLGAPVILFLGLASIVMTGTVLLAYLPLTYGWPNLAWAPVIVALLLGGTPLTRNHSVTSRVIKSAERGCEPRPLVTEDFEHWKTLHPEKPIVLVAAEGGASRSAWWTAHVLTALDYASDGEFSKNVYAVSGVSGGSLGSATYVGLLAERAGKTPAFTQHLSFPTHEQCWAMRKNRDAYPTPMQAECFLGEDFLSTTLGYMLFPDLVQRVVPVPVSAWDRSLGLEQTWQNDWAHLFGAHSISTDPPRATGRFGETLDTLYHPSKDAPRSDIPLLFLNSARAQTGRSALQSPVAIPSTELDDVFDGQLRTRGLPLSAVVHNSARFPLVSPGGEVETWNGDHWDTLVDGGYFENSGAATLAELIHALLRGEKPPLSDDDLKRIRVIFIKNTPAGDLPILRAPPGPDDPVETRATIGQEELMTPLLGLYNSRSARADSSKRALIALLPDPATQVTEIFLSRGLALQEVPENPAMSWFMNSASRRAMWAAVAEDKATWKTEPGADKTTYAKLCKVITDAGAPLENCSRLKQFNTVQPEGER